MSDEQDEWSPEPPQVPDPTDAIEWTDGADEAADDTDEPDLGSDVDAEMEIDESIAADDLLGGLQIETTEEIHVPDRLVDQVIGQEEARDIVKKAAKQHRHVMMIGSPGTGKSMLAKAM
ncbi:MAG: ATP-binding protein, partial [Halobacteriota archaeon]